MNSAYFDNLDLIASSTRIRSVWFFGDFGGDFRIAKGPLLFCTRSLIKRAGNFACSDSAPRRKGRRVARRGRERPQETFGRLGRKNVGFYKRGCQEKTLLHPQERNQISDIPLRPSDCNTICCVPRNFSLHVAGRSRRHSGTCKQRGGY